MADQTSSSIVVSSQDFTEKVLQTEQLVIVNFFSDRSPTCQIFEPELARTRNPELARQFQIRSLVEHTPKRLGAGHG